MLGSIQETLAPKAEEKQDPEVKDFRYPPMHYIHSLHCLHVVVLYKSAWKHWQSILHAATMLWDFKKQLGDCNTSGS